ncbi:MAG: hypothetical protein EBU32_06925 [Opitutaceae bacterium]|jgi:hypothetical protein|nr:hypothetical protein [Opitutaceae bacterium]
MRAIFNSLRHSLRSTRPYQLMVLGLLALTLGLALDWLRPAQRLVFPRPLPVFKITPPVS